MSEIGPQNTFGEFTHDQFMGQLRHEEAMANLQTKLVAGLQERAAEGGDPNKPVLAIPVPADEWFRMRGISEALIGRVLGVPLHEVAAVKLDPTPSHQDGVVFGEVRSFPITPELTLAENHFFYPKGDGIIVFWLNPAPQF